MKIGFNFVVPIEKEKPSKHQVQVPRVLFIFHMVNLGIVLIVICSNNTQFFCFNIVYFTISMICFPFYREDQFDSKSLISREGQASNYILL